MSMADTAEYTLATLAGVLESSDDEINRNSQLSAEYKRGYRDALESVAEDMNLTVTVQKKFSL